MIKKLSQQDKEDFGWMLLGEESMNEVWDGDEDEVWAEYL